MSSQDLEALAAKIQAMPPPDKLRLAASLLEQRKAKLAHTIAKSVVDELGLVLFVHEHRQEAR